jgi:hypothetical protein
MRRAIYADVRLLALCLAAAVALFLSPLTLQPTALPFAPGAAYSDALIAHLSSARFLHRSVVQWGQIPLWNPTVLSGIPFAADPLSGLWYPPFWVLALIPEAVIMNLLLSGHLCFGGYGMFRLLRSEGLGGLAGLTGALAFAGMPKLVGHVGLGHLSLVASVSWSPWVLLAVGRSVEGLQLDHWLRRFVLLGILLGVTFVADPRWIVPLVITAVGYGGWRWITRPESRSGGKRRLAGGGFAAVVGMAAVAAGLALPFGEFILQTTRAGMTTSAANVFALPPERLIGLIVPTRGGWAEWMVSMGSVTLVAAAAGVGGSWKRSAFWLGLFLVALLLALGDRTPVGQLVSWIPGAGLIRVPARWLFISGMSLAVLAAYGVDAFSRESDSGRIRRATLPAVLVAGVILLTSIGLGVMAGAPASAAGAGLLALLTLVIFHLAGQGWRPIWAMPLLPALLVAELSWIDGTLIQPRTAAASLAAGRAIANSLSGMGEGERVFSPSYSVPQEAAAEAGVEMADGVHPLQLADYVDFMAAATGFDAGSYSVTLPPFPSGDPSVDWGPEIDADALGLLAVSRVVSQFPVDSQGLQLEPPVADSLVYVNTAARPRAWIESAPGGEAPGWRPVDSLEWTPNHVRMVAQGPGTLVLSDPMYPGWQADLDGQRAAVSTSRGLLRSVEIPAGSHEVQFVFTPVSLFAGLGVSLLAAAFGVALWRRP